jgi:hypothetical protein
VVLCALIASGLFDNNYIVHLGSEAGVRVVSSHGTAIVSVAVSEKLVLLLSNSAAALDLADSRSAALCCRVEISDCSFA